MSDQPPSWSPRHEHFLEHSLPSSDDAEKIVLGSILLDNQAFLDAAEILTAADFYSPTYRMIYAAMLSLFEQSLPIEAVLIGEEIKKQSGVGSLDGIGGISVIVNLTYGLNKIADISNYVKVVKDKAQSRLLLSVLESAKSNTLAQESDLQTILTQAESALYALNDDTQIVPFVNVTDLFAGRLEAAAHAQETGYAVVGLSTGFNNLDSLLAGLHNGDLIIIGARPSMGKTALASMLGQNAAFRGGKIVFIFSLEMSADQLAARVICSEAGINNQKLRSGLMNEHEWTQVNEALSHLGEGRLMINDDASMTVLKIRQRLKRMKMQDIVPDLIIIDYLQLMDGDSQRSENRQQEVTKISRNLKKLAKELNIPVIALSQLSRAPEQRAANNHRPQLGDLRESGAIEQDADVVMLLYRESEYPKPDGTVVGQGQAEIIVAKQRNGPTDTVILAFDKPSTRFSNMEHNY